jgi:hypothetical protein
MTRSKIRTSGAEGLTLSSTDITIASGDLLFGTSAKGPVIGATSNTDGNTLDDYEEGSFSPTLKNEGDTNLSTTKNSTYNNARYVKVGPIVFIQFTVSISSLSGDSSSQNLIIDNLPFTSKAYQANSNGSFNITYQSNVDTTSTYGVVLGSSDNMRFYAGIATPLYSNALQYNSYIQGYGHYETDS